MAASNRRDKTSNCLKRRHSLPANLLRHKLPAAALRSPILAQNRSQTVGHFRSALRRSAQRAFIKSESLFRPAALSRRLRGARVAVVFERPRRALSRAQRALAAAAIFARAAADSCRRPPPVFAAPARRPSKLARRLSSALMCLRIDTACSKSANDTSIWSSN